MAELLFLLTIIAIFALLAARSKQFKIPSETKKLLKAKWPGVKPTTSEALSALLSHIDIADKILTSEKPASTWKAEPISSAQENRLKQDGIKITNKSLKLKGIASNLIGISTHSDDSQINEYLSYFGYSVDEMSETRVRLEYQERINNPDSMKMWEDRPPSDSHQLYCIYQNIKLPPKSTFADAEALVSNHQTKNLTNKQIDEWSSIESLWEEIQDQSYREMVSIKLPKQKEYIEAIKYYQTSDKRSPENFDEDLILYFLTLRNAKLKAH